ncbi:MAG TPA: hypothetical protein VE135_02695 [Pyrinomonadaceae bacterium]|nr:hypothetical protein [Pyrinomonadaceae bacterium]
MSRRSKFVTGYDHLAGQLLLLIIRRFFQTLSRAVGRQARTTTDRPVDWNPGVAGGALNQFMLHLLGLGGGASGHSFARRIEHT